MFDIAIINGNVYNSASKTSKPLNIGIRKGCIERITEGTVTAKREIDACGMEVVPGFIDIHMHEDEVRQNACDKTIAYAMLRMGVTTAVGGNCGYSPVSIAKYFQYMGEYGFPINIALYYGYNGLRRSLNGHSKSTALRGDDTFEHFSELQIASLMPDIRRAMEEGAIGLSFGLEYSPGCTTEEVIQTVNMLKPYEGALTAAHYRYDVHGCIKSIDEAIAICRETGIPFQFSHIGSCAAFGDDELMRKALARLTEAYAGGVNIMADCYPYTAFSALIGTTVFDEGCFERWGSSCHSIYIVEGPYQNQYCTPAIFHELRKNLPNTRVIGFVMTDAGVDAALRHPLVMVASDGRFSGKYGHPRGAGTFPRILGRYVRERGLLSFEDAIDKMTLLPAQRLGLQHKGRIQEGCDADIVVLDRNKISDCATFDMPLLAPNGISHVLVNGKICVKDGVMINTTAGMPVKRPIGHHE